MEINLKEIFTRLNLQYIRGFAFEMNPEPIDTEFDNLPYEERLEKGSALLLKRFKELYKDDPKSRSDVMLEFFTAVRVYSDVYAEIGIQAGARLLYQLISQNNQIFN
ncbi:MAG: hypothetical protein FWD71_10050 [Oscillospiraceae bacterium]|nr:hypothetical protein [Oscillospiraceae bacterium]